jgi:cytochrome c biogenesis protein CcmG, thiol:disulfide interchange protein DsbE
MLYRVPDEHRLSDMRSYLREAAVLVGFAVLVLELNAWAGGGPQHQPQTSSALLGRMAPNLQATEWIGAPVDLRDFRGKVVVLDFWSAANNASRQQLASLRRLRERYGNQVVMVGVTRLDGQTIDKIHDIVRKIKAPDFVAIDHDNLTHRAYHVEQIPQTFIIDREGVVSFASVAADEAQINTEVERAINGATDTQ